MKKHTTRRVLAALAAVVFALVLAACGGGNGGGGTEEPSDPAENFIGLWEIVGMQQGDTEYSSKEIDEMKEYGFVVYIELDKDGDAAFELFGEALEGSWEAKSSTRAVMIFDNEEMELRRKGSKLTIEADGDEMSFEKIDPADRIEARDLSELGSALEEELGALGAGGAASGITEDLDSLGGGETEEKVEEMSQVIVDDDTCKIEITGKKQDWLGYSGYTLRVENKSDADFEVGVKYGTFSVDGKMCDPMLYESVRAGKYAETEMLFSDEDVKGLEALKNVEGTIQITDKDYKEIASYDLKVD